MVELLLNCAPVLYYQSGQTLQLGLLPSLSVLSPLHGKDSIIAISISSPFQVTYPIPEPCLCPYSLEEPLVYLVASADFQTGRGRVLETHCQFCVSEVWRLVAEALAYREPKFDRRNQDEIELIIVNMVRESHHKKQAPSCYPT